MVLSRYLVIALIDLILASHDEAREELEEYQISSRELEAELEAQLEQQESKNRELTASNQRMQMELDTARVCVHIPFSLASSCAAFVSFL